MGATARSALNCGLKKLGKSYLEDTQRSLWLASRRCQNKFGEAFFLN
jgi:hypothetical protein